MRPSPSEELLAALGRPASYPGAPAEVILRETHISWVFLAGERAYKLKKPLRTAFLDYGTPSRRRELCHEEVRLNARLAPRVYLGVRGVAVDPSGAARLLADDDPAAVDYLVEMRRYDESATLAAKLARGEATAEEIDAVAQLLARFHLTAPAAARRASPVLAAERRFEQNAHELAVGERRREPLGRILALERFAHAFIGAHAALLEGRARRGCVRDGHGDVRAEHVVFGGGVQIVDCIEFSRELRELDVADDLAFLVLDLAALGAEQLGARLLATYRACGGDAGPPPLIAFYAAYRALVRAKVTLLRAEQEAAVPGCAVAAGRDEHEADRLIALAQRFAWRARLPLVLAVCGTPATGKSHLAAALARASGLAQINSDVTRKQLAGLAPAQRAPAEVYTRQFSARTYETLGTLAAAACERDGGVIVDATFRHRAERSSFASSFVAGAPVLFVECQVPLHALAARADARRHGEHDASDAGPEVVLRERRAWEPLDEIEAAAHLVLRTDRAAGETLAELTALLDLRLGRIPALTRR